MAWDPGPCSFAVWIGVTQVTNGLEGAAGFATFATGLLPRRTGWPIYVGVVLCAVSINIALLRRRTS
jgi:hypothetical protein